MILYFLRLILFLLSFYGLSIFVKEKLKIKKEFSYVFTTIIIILLMFISSLLNILIISSLIIYIFGFINLIYNIKKEKKLFFKLDYKTIIILLFVLYLTVLGLNLKITSYDNFSHWALIVKQLFNNNTLPSFEYNLVDFTSYPPGSALFIYYIGILVGKIEATMIISQLYLTFIFLTPLMAFFKEDKKVINAITFILVSLFILISNIPLMDLMVDTLLGTMGIASCCIAYYYRKDLKKSFILLTLMSATFILIKNSGLLFIAFNCLLLFLVGLYNKKGKTAIKYCLFMLISSFIIFVLWQQHLKLVYPANTGVTTKHSLSIVNFGRTIYKNGIAQSIEVALKYLSSFYMIKGNIILYYLIGINLFLVFLMFASKKYKQLLKILMFVDVIYLCYWVCLGFMYILSMPYDEAIRLASYSRYMMTCIIVLFGIAFLVILELNIDKKIMKKICSFIFAIGIILCICFNPLNSYKDLFNFKGNDNSEIIRMENFTKDYPIEEYKDKTVYLYFDCNFKTYYYYVLQYKYFSDKFNIECEYLDIDKLKDGTIIIIPDDTKKIETKRQVKKLKENVFEIVN